MTGNDFRAGLKKGIAVALYSSPFGLLFGALAVENGLSVFEAGLMSATIFAGASQLVGIELFGHHVAAWLVILSVFAVNFRHVLYSAAIARYITHFTTRQKALAFFVLTDPQFAETARKTEAGQPVSFPWYMGMGLAMYVSWLVFSVVGGFLGQAIGDPRVIAIDVLLPVYFLGLVVGFRHKPAFYPVVAASALGSVVGYHFVGSPWHVSVGAVVGVAVAALLPPPKQPAETTTAADPRGKVES